MMRVGVGAKMLASCLLVLAFACLSNADQMESSELKGPERRLHQHTHPTDYLIPIHGWFMTTAFAIIMPAAILMPIVFKRTKMWPVLYWVHLILNILAVLFVTAGVALGAKLYRNASVQYIHRGIGIAVIALLWLQVVVALSTRPFLSGKLKVKGIYNVFHRWGGATAFIVGVGNAYYGMMISLPPTRYFVGYSVALGGWILIAMFGQAFVYSSEDRYGVQDAQKSSNYPRVATATTVA